MFSLEFQCEALKLTAMRNTLSPLGSAVSLKYTMMQ